MARLVLVAALGTLWLLSCIPFLGGGNGDEPTVEPQELLTLEEDQTPEGEPPVPTLGPTPEPQPTVTVAPSPVPTVTPRPTPVVQMLDDARKLVAIHVGQCLTLQPAQLDGYQVGGSSGDWYVQAAGEDPPSPFGLW